jgi:hypothetical protein
MIDLFCQLMEWNPAFFIPSDSREVEFLFLPSDEQYCGPGGPHDRNFDPRLAPRADDSYIQCRAIMLPVAPLMPDAELPANARPPAARQVPASWFLPAHVNKESYNTLVRVATERTSEPMDVSVVDGGNLRTRNCVFANVWHGRPRRGRAAAQPPPPPPPAPVPAMPAVPAGPAVPPIPPQVLLAPLPGVQTRSRTGAAGGGNGSGGSSTITPAAPAPGADGTG